MHNKYKSYDEKMRQFYIYPNLFNPRKMEKFIQPKVAILTGEAINKKSYSNMIGIGYDEIDLY